ncbi:MAG: hypothetical protein QOE42_513 [Chloroflexota bacterium]|nr:hypothetical protein [Chloroflexota bacterium]
MATTRPRRTPDRLAPANTDAVAARGKGSPAGDAAPTREAAPDGDDVAEASGADLISAENQATLHHALEEAARLLRSDGAMAYLLDPTSGLLMFADDAGITDDRRRSWVRTLQVEPGVGLFGRAVAERRINVTGDYPNDPGFVHFPGADRLVKTLAIRSFLVAPLVAGDRMYGALGTYSSRPDAFREHDVALVRALADHAAAAMANAELIEQLAGSRAELERRADAERALREIGARITAIRDPAELLQQVADSGRRLLDGDRAQLDIVDPVTGLLRWTAVSGEAPFGGDLPGAVEGGDAALGINGVAIETRAVYVTGDYVEDPRIHHVPASDDFVRRTGLMSVVAVPLMSEADLLGILKVSTTRRNAFDDEDAALMAAFGDQVVVAIQNARLIDELDRSREENSRRADAERSVRQIAADISALRDVEAILQQTVDEARRLLVSSSARIDMLDDGGTTLRWAFASGEDAVRTRATGFDAEFNVGEGIAGLTVATGRAFRTGDYLVDERFTHVARSDALVEATGFRSVLSAPLLGETGPLGALSVSSELPDHYDDNQAELLQGLADQAAIAIQNARLIAELDASTTELARRADAEQSLREIAAQINATREPGALLQQVVEAARRLVGADGSVLDLVEPDGATLRWAFDAGVAHLFSADEIAHMTIPIGVGATGLAVAENRVITASDDPRLLFPDSEINDRFFDGTSFRSMIIAPVNGEAGPLGALEVYAVRPAAFDDDDAGIIRALADQAAIALLNARLIDELERSQTELEARAETERSLRDISARITSLGDPGEILARVVEESRRLLRSDGAHLTRMSEDGTYLVPVIVAGGMDLETEAWLKQMTFPLGGGINGLAAEEIRPTWTHDYAADPRIPHEPGDDDAAERLGLRAMAAAPLRAAAGEVIGTLAVSYAEPREILPDELDLLQGLADQAAIALANSNLYELLGESEARYRYLVQNSPDLVWSIDADSRFTFISDTCQRLTGWRADELLGQHFGALVHGSSREVAEIDWTAGLVDNQGDSGRQLRGRVNLLRRDGSPLPAEFIAFATRDENGRFAGANGSVRDMSERDRLERQLRASEERYRFLVDNSPDIIFSTDADGRYTYYSETIERLTGYGASDLMGKHFSTIIDLDTFPDAERAWQAFIDEPSRMQVQRFRMRRLGGGSVPVEVNAIGMTDAANRFAGIHGAARDISERERLERDLRRQAGELASSQERAHLARELHDSVTQALFSMTLVTRSVELLIDRDVAVAKEKLGSLRDLQREALAEMRALIFELRPGNLENDGLLPALRTHTAALQGRIGLPVVVTSELTDRLPLEVEEVLYRIAQEALHNVVKHAAARQVELAVDRRGADVVLRIRDDGKGFDAALVPDGHLGLTGMRARADKIGASYVVTSWPGEGTTIEVVVPPAAIERAAGAAGLAAPADGAVVAASAGTARRNGSGSNGTD